MANAVTLTTLAKMIDHSLLHPTMTDKQIADGCELAKRSGVATVCVKPYAIELSRRALEGSDVGISAVVAFPHGNSTTAIKVKEAREAVSAGASEIDMVVNIGKVIGGDWAYVADEIRAINDAVVDKKALLKVIFENDYLGDDHIVQLCKICSEAEVAFVKTSSGYGFVKQPNGFYAYAGATDHHLRLMRANCPQTVEIKAAGGVRTLGDLLRVTHKSMTRSKAPSVRTPPEAVIPSG